MAPQKSLPRAHLAIPPKLPKRTCLLLLSLVFIPAFLPAMLLLPSPLPFRLTAHPSFQPQTHSHVPSCRPSPVSLATPDAAFSPLIHPVLKAALFDRYIAWHAQARPCLESPCRGGPPPVLVWACPTWRGVACAGVGDRMRGIQFAYIIAALTRRVLLVDWTDPIPLEGVLRPHFLDWSLPPALRALHRVDSEGGTIWLDVPRLNWFVCWNARDCGRGKYFPNVTNLPAELGQRGSGPRFDLLSSDHESLFGHKAEPVIAIETRMFPKLDYFLANPYFRRELFGDDIESRDISSEEISNFSPPFELRRAIMKALFEPEEAVAHVLRQRSLHVGNAFRSIHARIGSDFGEDVSSRFRKINSALNETANGLLDCLDKISNEYDRGQPVYLATDAQDFKRIFSDVATKIGLAVESSKDKAFHISTSSGNSEEDDDETRVCKSVVDVFADLWMLGRGSALVSTGSGFADVAFGVGSSSKYAEAQVLGKVGAATDVSCELRAGQLSSISGKSRNPAPLQSREQLTRLGS